jgi:hypothetical protein
MGLTLARSERVQNVLTHASKVEMYIHFYNETVSNACNFFQIDYFNDK